MSDISSTTRRRSSASRVRRTCPTFSSRSSSAVTDAELQVDRRAEPPGGQRLAPPRGVHDRDERADVGAVEPVQLGEPLPDRVQLDGQPAKEQRELPPVLDPSPSSRAILSTIEIIDRQGKSCLVCRPSPLVAARDHRPPLAGARRPPRLAGRRAQRRPAERLGRVPARQRRVHAGDRAAARVPDQPRAAGDPAVGGRRPAGPAAAGPDRRPRRAGRRRSPERARWRARPPRRSPRRTARRSQADPPDQPRPHRPAARARRRPARRSPPVDGTTAYVTGPGASFSDFADGFSGIDGAAAARRVRRRPADPAGRLPQPDPAVPRHRHGRPGADRLDGRRLPAGQGRLDRGQRPEPGHLLDPRRRRRHRLRPAAGRPLPRGTARGAVEVHRDADRAAASRGRRSSPAAPRSSSASSACSSPTSAPTAGLGPISAVSVALAVVAALTFLPAVLVLLGRAAFWPFRPQYGSEHRHGRGWERVAQIVGSPSGPGAGLDPRRPLRRRVLRAHVLRRRHPAQPGGARRHPVGHRPGRRSSGTSTPAAPAPP